VLLGLLAAAAIFTFVSAEIVRSQTEAGARREFDRQAVEVAALISQRLSNTADTDECGEFRRPYLEALIGEGARLYVTSDTLPFCPGDVEPQGDLYVAPPDLTKTGDSGPVRIDFQDPADPTPTVATVAPIINRETGVALGEVVLTRPKSAVTTTWSDVLPSLLAAAAIGFAIALGLTLLLTARILRPLRQTEEAADRVAAGDLSVTLAPAGTQELDHVAEAFNGMVARLREREDSAREFLMKVTHDLRTPLTAISGHAAALADGIVPEPQVPRSLAAIEGEAHRLEAMVTDLLDLARMDARRFRIDPGPAEPSEILSLAFDAHAADAARRDIRYERRIDALPGIVTDAARMQQIVGNLLDNALRWAPEGGEVVLAASPLPDGGVRVAVCDSGPGVPEDQRELVFEPFRSSETPDGRTGTGLGLPICRQLARALGGEVVVDEAPEGGARFLLELPAAPPGTPRRGPRNPLPAGGRTGP
jgi:two-component system sensor histidine kinase BaeS